MTIGRNNEAPAAYSLTSTIKRLLDHLTEVDLYSSKDLTHCEETLKNLRDIVDAADSKYSADIVARISTRIDHCQTSLRNLQTRLARLGGDLPAIHEKLISILRSISLANTKAKVRLLTSPLNDIHYSKSSPAALVTKRKTILTSIPRSSQKPKFRSCKHN